MQNFQNSFSILCVMASSSKRARVGGSDSHDSENSLDLMEETTGGLESADESEISR